ncbi:HNH endonuclease (plasmid) [Acidiphilium multivorum]|uniref:HNH endonuclease n=1 Tax=Acidiphilium TaxID=522 RepID=UPI00157A42CA|nr:MULTISPECIES: HNH endonuclease [Acidiphilium]UNC16235.1 HNH endonuclease [Acidiphilium multivorum]
MLDVNTQNLDQRRALLLNGDFRPMSVSPLATLSWEDAISGVLSDRLTVVAEYDDCEVRSARRSFRIPSVVASREFVNLSRPAPKTRWNVILAYRFTCAYCGASRLPVEDLTFDHVIPRSRGGPSTWMNIVLACRPCNEHKADRTPAEAGMPLLVKPHHPTKAKLNALALRHLDHKASLHRDWVDYLYWDTRLED